MSTRAARLQNPLATPWLPAAILTAGTLLAGAAIVAALATQDILLLAAAVIAIGLCTFAFLSERYEATLLILLLYIGLLDGYLKNRGSGQLVVLGRDILLYAIVFGAAARLLIRRKALDFPPLTFWLLLWVGWMLVQVFNTHGGTLSHNVQALRPHFEFVPLFFFGYVALRHRRRIRWFLVALLAIAAVNGAVSLVQINLTPEQLAAWGPGYSERVHGTADLAPGQFVDSSGRERVRPFGLGSDIGFAGVVGLLAAPGALALLMLSRNTVTKLTVVPLAALTVVGVVTSQARVVIVGTVIGLMTLLILTTVARKKVATIVAAAVATAMAYVVVSALLSTLDPGTFNRYRSISPDQVLSTTWDYRKNTIEHIGEYAVQIPLGAGLGTVGPGTSVPGNPNVGMFDGESQFTFLLVEGGVIALAILLVLHLKVLTWARRIRRIDQPDQRVLLAALAAPLFGLFAAWIAGPTTATTPASPYFWFVAGALAFWLARERGGAVSVAPMPRTAEAQAPRAPLRKPPATPVLPKALPQNLSPPMGATEAPRLQIPAPRRPSVAPRPQVPARRRPSPAEPQPQAPDRRARRQRPARRGAAERPQAASPDVLAAPERQAVTQRPTSPVRIGLLYADRPGETDAIRDTTERLIEALGRDAALYLWSPSGIQRVAPGSPRLGELDDVVLQYSPFSFGRGGIAPALLRDVGRLKVDGHGPKLTVVVHEPCVPMNDGRTTVMGLGQRAQLRSVIALADRVLVSTTAWIPYLGRQGRRRLAGDLPSGSTLPDGRATRDRSRRHLGCGPVTFTIALYGTDHPSRLLGHAARAVNRLADMGHDVILLNLGRNAPELPELSSTVRELRPGPLPAEQVAELLAAADVLLAPFVDGVTTRRTTVAAALQQAVPVIGLDGPLTDETTRRAGPAIELLALTSPERFADGVSRILAMGDLRQRSQAARQWYEEQLDWPVLAARLRAAIRR
jgi:glycosyltransferase involved in cell wall biosynthesis